MSTRKSFPLVLTSSLLALLPSQSAAQQPGTVVRQKKISEVSGVFPGGLDPDDQMGRAVISPGDIDGDGNADLISGAVGDDDGGTQGLDSDTGALWVHFMGSNGQLLHNQKISMTSGGLAAQLDTRDQFGRALAPLGDFDGDGIPDVAVGSARDDDGGVNRGAIYLLMLNSDGTVKAEHKISDTQGDFHGGLEDLDEFGRAIANLGDLNGDGVVDLAVGATGDDDGGADLKGAVYVLFLKADGTVKQHQKISDTQGDFLGILGGGDLFGFAIANLGDVNGDGVVDIAVGTPKDDDGGVKKGAAWVLFLRTNGKVKGFRKISDVGGVYGLMPGDEFGSAVAGLGDLDADGIPDLAVGAILDDGLYHDQGAIWINFLNSDGSVKSKLRVTEQVNGFTGKLAAGDWFGASMGPIADLDGDGRVELAVGARFDDDGGSDTGSIWILFLNGAQNIPPTNAFLAQPTSGPAPLNVAFDERCSAGAHSFLWSFGDGASSTAANPAHLYTQPGLYTVTLTASGPGGQTVRQETGLIWVTVQAQATVRNGSGVNRLGYQTAGVPVLGASWAATVDTAPHPGALAVMLLACDQPHGGLLLPAGEVLVRTPALGGVVLFKVAVAPVGGSAHFSLPIPNNPALVGLQVYTQAVVLGGPLELCNAVDLVLGL